MRKKHMTFNREEIKIENVPYFGMVNDKVGYIKLTMFTDNASQEVQDALKELKKKSEYQRCYLRLAWQWRWLTE
jgi:carboxyl-terminal processing protease